MGVRNGVIARRQANFGFVQQRLIKRDGNVGVRGGRILRFYKRGFSRKSSIAISLLVIRLNADDGKEPGGRFKRIKVATKPTFRRVAARDGLQRRPGGGIDENSIGEAGHGRA